MARRRTARPASGRPRGEGGGTFGLVLSLAVLVAFALGVGWLIRLPSTTEMAPLAEAHPATTALIEARREEAAAEGRPLLIDRRPVPLRAVATELIACVLASEDARFLEHDGIDDRALSETLRKAVAERKLGRGASTLTQQLAKNLWLGEARSLPRKWAEAMLATRLESALTKARLLELYLSLVELGDGRFGVEAAARHRFGKAARDLTLSESAELAALLPAPRRLEAHPEELLPRVERVLRRVEAEGLARPAAVASSLAQARVRLSAMPRAAVDPAVPGAPPT